MCSVPGDMAVDIDNSLNLIFELCSAFTLTNTRLKHLTHQYANENGSDLNLRRPLAESREVLSNILWALMNIGAYNNKLSEKIIYEMRIMDLISTSIRIMDEIDKNFYSAIKLILNLATNCIKPG